MQIIKYMMEDFLIMDGLQELPDPITRQHGAMLHYVAPKTASKIKLKTGDVINIVVDENQLEIPYFISPGQAINS